MTHQNKPKQQSLGTRILIDIAVGVGIIVVIFFFVFVQILIGRPISGGWFGLVGATAYIFWLVTKALKRYWKRPAFWYAVTALAILQTFLFVEILLHYPQLPMMWFMFLIPLEAPLLYVILVTVFDRKSKLVRSLWGQHEERS